MARQLSVIDDTKAPPPAPPAPPVPGERTIRIPVSGMTCAACQARVQRTLQRQPGVVDAGVNLMMHDATVRYAPDAVTPEQLVAAIRDTGYGAELPPAVEDAFAEQEARDEAQAEEFATLKRKAIVSGIVGAVAMVAPMVLMPLAPHALINGVLLVLTVAVMAWAGHTRPDVTLSIYAKVLRRGVDHGAAIDALIAPRMGTTPDLVPIHHSGAELAR
jgi:cation transport ATPase